MSSPPSPNYWIIKKKKKKELSIQFYILFNKVDMKIRHNILVVVMIKENKHEHR